MNSPSAQIPLRMNRPEQLRKTTFVFFISASVNQCTSGNVVVFNNTYINSPGFPTGVSSATSCNTTGISGRSGNFLSSLFAFFAENLRKVRQFGPFHS
jgi:hypothetical protein